MKLTFTTPPLFLIVCYSLSGCTVNRYYYVAEDPVELYEFSSLIGRPVVIAQPGDTLSATNTKIIQLGGPVPVEYKGYRFYSPTARARFVGKSKVNLRKDAALPGITYEARKNNQKTGSPASENKDKSSYSHGFGIGLGFGTERALQLEGMYRLNRHMFRLGYLHQYNGQLGELKGSRLANYGANVIGRNTYFTAFPAGYSFWITDRIGLGIEGCIGSDGAYQNYADKRFKAGGYHMITSSAPNYGFGGRIDYLLTKVVMLSSGYNYLTGANLTVSFTTFGFN